MPNPRNPNIGIPLEEVVHQQVCQYLRVSYPNAMFNSDGAGHHLSPREAGLAKMLKSDNGYPDLFVPEPRGRFFGLFLELKRENATIFLKNGKLSLDSHVQKQAEAINRLIARGYYANFAIGFEDAKTKIDWYMNLGPCEGLPADMDKLISDK